MNNCVNSSNKWHWIRDLIVIIAPIIVFIQIGCGSPSTSTTTSPILLSSKKESNAKEKISNVQEILLDEVPPFEKSNDWQIKDISVHNGQYLSSLFFLNSSLGWVGGIAELFKTHDGGLSWQRLSLPIIRDYKIKLIRFRNEHVGWLVAEPTENHKTKGIDRITTILSTQDGGQTWEKAQEWTSVSITDLVITNKEGWISGIHYFEYDGPHHIGHFLYFIGPDADLEDRSFHLTAVPEAAGSGLMGISVTLDGRLFVVTSAGMIFVSADLGITWSRFQTYQPRNNRINSLGVESSNRLWVTEGSRGREGIGSRFVVFERRNEEAFAYIFSLPGLFLNSTINFSDGRFISVASTSCDSNGFAPCEMIVLDHKNSQSSWKAIFSVPISTGSVSISTAGSDKVFVLLNNQIFRLQLMDS